MAVRVLSSDFLSGTFEVRCEIPDVLKVDTGHASVSFETPFSREHDWKLILCRKIRHSEELEDDMDLLPEDSKITMQLQRVAVRTDVKAKKMSTSEFSYEMTIKVNSILDVHPDHQATDEPIIMTRAQLEPYTVDGNLVVRMRIKIFDCKLPKELVESMKLYHSIDGDLCDFDIVTPEGKFSVFQNILCLKWPYFETMFNSDFLESTKNSWTVDDVTYETMKAIVVYIYCGAITFKDKDQVIEIVKAAHRYQVTDLVAACSHYLRWDVDVKHALELFVISDLYQLRDLKSKCSEIVSEALVATRINRIPGYKEFKNNPQCLRLTHECFRLAARVFDRRLRTSKTRKRKHVPRE
ncbi:Uncharacterized protein HDE_08820 [Halotydeus destructor]|nr:Uncharacterized protein HDE_08820 [Halotydeus destructor]